MIWYDHDIVHLPVSPSSSSSSNGPEPVLFRTKGSKLDIKKNLKKILLLLLKMSRYRIIIYSIYLRLRDFFPHRNRHTGIFQGQYGRQFRNQCKTFKHLSVLVSESATVCQCRWWALWFHIRARPSKQWSAPIICDTYYTAIRVRVRIRVAKPPPFE